METGHPNVTGDFFQAVIDAAVARGMELVAVLSTTGHAGGFISRHPELAIRARPGGHSKARERLRGLPAERAVREERGAAHAGSGVMCHHRPGARAYALKVMEECLTRYSGFSGAVLHPPEFIDPCFCDQCTAVYRREKGGDLASASDEAAQRFFMETSLAYQTSVLEPRLAQLIPGARRFTFTIPWVFEDHFEELAGAIDPNTVIIDWDYDLSPQRLEGLQGRLKRYQGFGHQVWFMPTCGYGIAEGRSRSGQEAAVISQIGLCLDTGVRNIVYFLGPVWPRSIEGTSYFLHGPG